MLVEFIELLLDVPTSALYLIVSQCSKSKSGCSIQHFTFVRKQILGWITES